MKKCISQWAIKGQKELSALDVFKKARKAGFEGVELCGAEQGHITPDSTRQDCQRLLDQADEAGVVIPSLLWGFNGRHRPTDPDPAVRAKGRKILKKGLQLGNWLGVPGILVVPGRVGGDTDKRGNMIPYEKCVAKAEQLIRGAVPTAKKLNCAIALEYVWNNMLTSPLEYRDFIDRIGSPMVGFYLDTGNMLNISFAEEWARIMGRRTLLVHLKDWKRSVGGFRGFCDLLEGDCHFPAVMKELRKNRYNGPLTAEYGELSPKHLLKISKAMDKILEM